MDLRVATIARNTVIAHRFPNIPLETALRDVKDFVTENPSEVVIIQFKADWDNREDVNWVEVVAKFSKSRVKKKLEREVKIVGKEHLLTILMINRSLY